MESEQESLWPWAVIGILILSLLPSKRNQPSEAVHPQNRTEAENPNPPRPPALVSNPVPSQPNTDSANGSKKRTPFWEKLAVLAALGVLVVNAWQWRDLIKARQAWVGVTRQKILDVDYRYGARVNGQVTLKNFGGSPAFNVVTQVALAPSLAEGDGMIDSAAKSACGTATDYFERSNPDIIRATKNREQGNTLFPGQEIPSTPFVAAGMGPVNVGDGVFLLGCIVYRDERNEVRKTRFCIYTPGWPYQPDISWRCTIYEAAK